MKLSLGRLCEKRGLASSIELSVNDESWTWYLFEWCLEGKDKLFKTAIEQLKERWNCTFSIINKIKIKSISIESI